jgi:hypothetical protein
MGWAYLHNQHSQIELLLLVTQLDKKNALNGAQMISYK